MQGVGGQALKQPVAPLSLQGTITPRLTSQSNNQSVNNTISSQFNPYSSASWESATSAIPGGIVSTVKNLTESAITPPCYTQGGAPLAGGSFPYNYHFT
jgi:hypothetical protein